MTIIEKITEDLNFAVKKRDQLTIATLRLLLANLHNVKIAKGRMLNYEEIIAEITKDIKRHKESIEAYIKGQRLELANKEKEELLVLQKYLPKQLDQKQLTAIIDKTISETGASSSADLAKVMSQVMAKVKGQADGAVVSSLVLEKLDRI